MAVFRVNKTENYTVMSNWHLRDKSLSLKAKGLLSQMLSLPNEWDYSVEGLVSINKESKTAIQSTLKELENSGYLTRTRTQNEKGHFDYIYDIFEDPQTEEPQTENPYTANQTTEKPCTENQPQLNTNQLNTKELNTKDKETNNNASIKQIEKEFNTLWDAYPRKQGKANALKAYTKARKSGVEFQKVLDGVYCYAAYLKRNKVEDRFIKQGSTWFNQQCWNDEYKTGSAPIERDAELDAIF